jgi:hypothetical protein
MFFKIDTCDSDSAASDMASLKIFIWDGHLSVNQIFMSFPKSFELG